MIAAALDATNVKALLAAVVIGAAAPVVGTWIVLRRMANLGDTMSHGTLAGVAVASATGANILVGALGAGLVMAVLLILLSSNSRLGQEAIVAISGTALFAVGVIVMSRQNNGEELEHILFGDVLQLTWAEIVTNVSIGAVAVAVVLALFGELRLASFDHVHAEQVGVHVELIHGILVVLLAVVTVISLRTVGSLMAATMLVVPAATARLATRTLRAMTALGAALGVGEALTGVMVGQALDVPPGATIAVASAVVFTAVYVASLPRRMRHHHRPLG